MNPDPGIVGLGSTLASLIVILLLLAVVAFVLKKLRASRFLQTKFMRSDINILSARPIGRQSSLLIVEAQGRRFLISAGRHGVTAIGALDGPSTTNPVPSASQPETIP